MKYKMQNFGKINETFNNLFVDGLVDKKKKNKEIFKVYINELKNNPTLRTQFKVYDMLENKVVKDAESSAMFIDECISILKNLDPKLVNETNNKLVKYLNKHGFELTSGYNLEYLHEHISNLAFTKKTPNNINSIIESKLVLSKFEKPILENKSNGVVEPYINSFIGPVMIENFNKKYENLTESEIKLFKTLTNTKTSDIDKEGIFNSNILECVDLVNKKLNEDCTIDEKDKFLRVKDKLLRSEYEAETFISEMIKITSLKEFLK